MRSFRILAGAAALACTVSLPACSKDKSSPTSPSIQASTTYSGLVVGSSTTASLAITFPSAVASIVADAPMGDVARIVESPLDISATLTIIGGGTVTLTGSYNSPNLTLSGSGWTFTGTMSNGVVSGTFTGPTDAGGFQAMSSPQGSPATLYCGTVSGTHNGQSTSGSFTLIAGSGVFLIVPGGGVILPRGTYTGNTLDSYSAQVSAEGGTITLTVQGTLSASSASGTYSVRHADASNETGTWQSTACGG